MSFHKVTKTVSQSKLLNREVGSSGLKNSEKEILKVHEDRSCGCQSKVPD